MKNDLKIKSTKPRHGTQLRPTSGIKLSKKVVMGIIGGLAIISAIVFFSLFQ